MIHTPPFEEGSITIPEDPPMKNWRRSSRMAQVTATAAPLITSVLTDGSTIAVVTFDQPVTWDSTGGSDFEVGGVGGSWIVQADFNQLLWDSGGTNLNPGDPWDWTSQDLRLTPVPNVTQTGLTT